MPCVDVARWISAAMPSGGKTAAARSWAGLQEAQPWGGLRASVFRN